jgi:hypothetical protein
MIISSFRLSLTFLNTQCLEKRKESITINIDSAAFLFIQVVQRVDITTPSSRLMRNGSSSMIIGLLSGIFIQILKMIALEVMSKEIEMPICCFMKDLSHKYMVQV